MNRNYQWLDCIPMGWIQLARQMIEACEAIDSTYEITDLKEKWGMLDIFSICDTEKYHQIEAIETYYSDLSKRICCVCGRPATKWSTGWILPWCDACGKDDQQYYKRFE